MQYIFSKQGKLTLIQMCIQKINKTDEHTRISSCLSFTRWISFYGQRQAVNPINSHLCQNHKTFQNGIFYTEMTFVIHKIITSCTSDLMSHLAVCWDLTYECFVNETFVLILRIQQFDFNCYITVRSWEEVLLVQLVYLFIW